MRKQYACTRLRFSFSKKSNNKDQSAPILRCHRSGPYSWKATQQQLDAEMTLGKSLKGLIPLEAAVMRVVQPQIFAHL